MRVVTRILSPSKSNATSTRWCPGSGVVVTTSGCTSARLHAARVWSEPSAVADSGGGQGARAPPFGKVKKCKRAPLRENYVLRSRKRIILRYYPPLPTEPRRLFEIEITKKFCYYPPPSPPLNRIGFLRSRNNSATTPPPPPSLNRNRLFEITKKFCYSPPPTESRRHGTSHESGPPP